MKLSQKDFRAFQAEAQKWIDRFGLQDWEVFFRMNNDNEDCRATCQTSELADRICAITLTEEWERRPEQAEILRCAFHEVLELLLMPLRLKLRAIAEVPDGMVDGECHRIIKILENAIWVPQSGKRK